MRSRQPRISTSAPGPRLDSGARGPPESPNEKTSAASPTAPARLATTTTSRPAMHQHYVRSRPNGPACTPTRDRRAQAQHRKSTTLCATASRERNSRARARASGSCGAHLGGHVVDVPRDLFRNLEGGKGVRRLRRATPSSQPSPTGRVCALGRPSRTARYLVLRWSSTCRPHALRGRGLWSPMHGTWQCS
jgi:hypothetical protein